jgi:sulfur dioxygenase
MSNTPLNDSAATSQAVTPAQGYAGDVPPALAWQWVQSGDAVLVDVRTDAEREWVGAVPGAVALAWKQWPGMAMNTGFDEGIKAAAAGKKVVLLCRSGVRSVAAARRATELGMQAYNVLEGFEGDADAQGHRGQTGGWRLRGLPWRQG